MSTPVSQVPPSTLLHHTGAAGIKLFFEQTNPTLITGTQTLYELVKHHSFINSLSRSDDILSEPSYSKSSVKSAYAAPER